MLQPPSAHGAGGAGGGGGGSTPSFSTPSLRAAAAAPSPAQRHSAVQLVRTERARSAGTVRGGGAAGGAAGGARRAAHAPGGVPPRGAASAYAKQLRPHSSPPRARKSPSRAAQSPPPSFFAPECAAALPRPVVGPLSLPPPGAAALHGPPPLPPSSPPSPLPLPPPPPLPQQAAAWGEAGDTEQLTAKLTELRAGVGSPAARKGRSDHRAPSAAPRPSLVALAPAAPRSLRCKGLGEADGMDG